MRVVTHYYIHFETHGIMYYIAYYIHIFFQEGVKPIQFPCLVDNNPRGEDFIGGKIYPSDIWMLSKQRYNIKTPPICYTPDGIAQPPFSIDVIKIGCRI